MSSDETDVPFQSELEGVDQLSEITESLIAMAQLDFGSPPSIRGDGPLDAVAVGLIALGEELQASLAAQRQAEEANEAKGRFLANISHELRTPLTTILGSAELLNGTTLDEKQSRFVRQVSDSGELLLRLITDVLDFAKIEAGRLSIEEQPFRLKDCLRRVVAPHRVNATKKGLVIEERWAGMADLCVLGDGHRLEQVLSNLVGNAVKYTDHGHIELDGGVTEGPEATLLHFRVRDTGPGIPADQHERIFERFTTGDESSRRRRAGAGLGLSISKALIASMGGQLRLESEPGLGATFSVQVPVQLIESGASASGETHSNGQSQCHVLVVDDTAMVRAVTADMLQVLGCTVVVVASGYEALSHVAEQDFDLILMDCQMPKMDGLETAKRMLSLYPDRGLQIVALSAHSSGRDEQISLAVGMVGHLNKPFRIEQLARTVQRFHSTKKAID